MDWLLLLYLNILDTTIRNILICTKYLQKHNYTVNTMDIKQRENAGCMYMFKYRCDSVIKQRQQQSTSHVFVLNLVIVRMS